MSIHHQNHNSNYTSNSYSEKESKTLEFKQSLPKNFSNIIKTCVAFANTAGGEIIIGIEDKTRKIIGATDQDIKKCFEELPNSIYDSISPTLIPDIFEKNINNVILVVIKISKGNNKPYFLKREGLSKGTYIRIAASTRRATEDYIAELMAEQKRLNFDSLASKATLNDLDKTLLKPIYGSNFSERQMLGEHILLETTNKEQILTNAALIAFGKHPENFIDEAYLICTHFRGSEGRDIIQTREIKGPLSSLLENTLELLKDWTEKNYKLDKGFLKGHLPVPEEALREALTNALIHRKYTIPGAIKAALYSDRIEVFSPGGFPGLITINNLGDGSTYLRNPLLAKFARKMHIVEKLGSGIRLIYQSCEKKSLKKPDFFEDGDFVKVVLYFASEKRPVTDLKQVILDYLNQKEQIHIKDILAIVKASRNTITNTLNALQKEGKVKRHGKGRGVYYQSIGKFTGISESD